MPNSKLLYQVTEKDAYGEHTGLALKVELDEEDGWVGYHTTTRGRQRNGVLIDETDKGFTFQVMREGKPFAVLTFEVLTVKLFDKHWRNQVTPGVPTFRTDADLHEWYRRQYGSLGYHY